MILCGDWAPGNKEFNIKTKDEFHLLNLEGPFLQKPIDNPPQKAGPLLYNSSLPDIPKVGFVLANNHLMDYGNIGLEKTISCLDRKNIGHCGAGINQEEARKGMIIEDQEIKFGIISCCEHQFGEASNTDPGVATYGPWVYKAIREIKENCDYVIISVHAGMEMAPIPTPYHRDLYKSYVDSGADLIHCHHAHRVQGIEYYKGKMICYGLGNFAVPEHPWGKKSHTLWSIAIRINPKKLQKSPEILAYRVEFLPTRDKVELLKNREREEKLEVLKTLSEVFFDEDKYRGIWQEVALRAYHEFGMRYIGWHRVSEPRTSFKTFLSQRLRSARMEKKKETRKMLLKKVMLSCDSHRYMIETALSVLSGENDDYRTKETTEFCNKWSI